MIPCESELFAKANAEPLPTLANEDDQRVSRVSVCIFACDFTCCSTLINAVVDGNEKASFTGRKRIERCGSAWPIWSTRQLIRT